MVKTGIGLGLAIMFVGVQSGIIPVNHWILAVNNWNDSGIWIDTETWND